MSSNNKYNKNKHRTEYSDMSGKKASATPGQFRLDIEDPSLDGIVEMQPYVCKPYHSRKYYEAFREFLKKSGIFGRTWHLYKAILDDPNLEELQWRLDHESMSEFERKHVTEIRDAVKNHQYVMREKQHCDTKEELFAKAEKEWSEYRRSLTWLMTCAQRANVPFAADDKKIKDIMICFFHLDDKVRGNVRREYYREKYVNKAMKAINKTGYYPPISIYDMEKAFKNDKEWQERFLHRKKT